MTGEAMNVTYEQDENGNRIKVTTYPSGAVAREMDRSEVAPSQSQIARAALREIDEKTGMSRTLREALIAAAGQNAPAVLVSYEAQAAIHRGKL